MPDEIASGPGGTIFMTARGDEDQHAADALLEQLVMQVGMATTIRLLSIALTKILIGTLHLDTPEPELNIQTIETLLLSMTERVSEHFECCRHQGEHDETTAKPPIH